MRPPFPPHAAGQHSLRPPPPREREILRLAARIGGVDGRETADAACREILKWAQRCTGDRLPEKAWEHLSFEHLKGGRNCVAVRLSEEGRDVWVLRADDPDKRVAQRIWTAEASVIWRAGMEVRLGVRLFLTSPEAVPDILPAVPGFVEQIATTCGLYHGVEICFSEENRPEPSLCKGELLTLRFAPKSRWAIFYFHGLRFLMSSKRQSGI